MLDAASISTALFQSSAGPLFQPAATGAQGQDNPAGAFSQALDTVRAELDQAVPNGVWNTQAGSVFRSSADSMWTSSSGALDDALGRIDNSLFGRTASNGNGIWKPTTETEKSDYRALVEKTEAMKKDGMSFMLSLAMFKLIGSYPTAVTKAFNGLLKSA